MARRRLANPSTTAATGEDSVSNTARIGTAWPECEPRRGPRASACHKTHHTINISERGIADGFQKNRHTQLTRSSATGLADQVSGRSWSTPVSLPPQTARHKEHLRCSCRTGRVGERASTPSQVLPQEDRRGRGGRAPRVDREGTAGERDRRRPDERDPPRRLLVAERFDRPQGAGAVGGVHAEQQADRY